MLVLLDACIENCVSKIVFSSSCATYGTPQVLPIKENAEQKPINPYGRTKLLCEQMLSDYAHAYGIKYVALRYFNAAGADPDGELGEWHEPETHLLPRTLMAAFATIKELEIYGDDHQTRDGTCVRDYVHVTDLAQAHLNALKYLEGGGNNLLANLGTGTGYSIAEVISAVENITSRKVPRVFRDRRPGDPPTLVADNSLAKSTLQFEPVHSSLETIVRTAAPFFNPDHVSLRNSRENSSD
jgi:UDP-arabinose 4-epimerase